MISDIIDECESVSTVGDNVDMRSINQETEEFSFQLVFYRKAKQAFGGLNWRKTKLLQEILALCGRPIEMSYNILP